MVFLSDSDSPQEEIVKQEYIDIDEEYSEVEEDQREIHLNRALVPANEDCGRTPSGNLTEGHLKERVHKLKTRTDEVKKDIAERAHVRRTPLNEGVVVADKGIFQ